MMPGIGVVRGVPSHRNFDEQMERQMGCMTGFIQLLDRHQILTGRRFNSTKRLPCPLAAGSNLPSEISEISTVSLIKDAPEFPFSPSPVVSPESHVPTNFPGRYTLPLPVFEMKDGLKASWKLPEAPRLSLDSRANVDGKGKLRPCEMQASPVVMKASEDRNNQEKQRRSPSVVARLMGLEELPIEGPPKRPELRRSASESRVTRDPSQFNFQNPFPMPSEEDFRLQKDYNAIRSRDTKPDGARQSPGLFQRKSFDAQEFFPEPKRLGSLSGEVEKRLRMRGLIEEPARDLDTLKQILEALQLKGLLHSKQPEHQEVVRLNDFHDRLPRSSAVQPPIVVIKPVRKPPPRLAGSEPPTLPSRSMPPRRIPVPEPTPPASSRRDRLEIDRNFHNAGRQSPRFPDPTLASRNPSDPPSRRRPLKDEAQRSPLPQRRIPAPHSPKSSPKRVGSGQSCPPKNRRPNPISPKEVYSTAEDYTSTSLSDTSNASHFDFESARNEDYSSGRRLLERCDKLLHSIAAITSSAEQAIPTDRQRSPVSVLDSSFDESLASSLPNRAIGFNDQLTDWREDHLKREPASTSVSDLHPVSHEQETTFDNDQQHDDYAFVLEVLHEADLHCSSDEAFASIENRHRTTTSSTLHRRLIFDTVTELLNRKRHLSPWDNFSGAIAATNATSLTREVWEELCQIQVRIPAADAMEATCSVIRKEMTASSDREQGWAVSGEEMSEAVLHIERLVFKDLVADTIWELADLTGGCRRSVALSRRKLVF